MSTNTLTELQLGNPITAMLSNPSEKRDYYFDLFANQPVMLSLTAPPQAYQWYHYKVEHPVPKPGPVSAHSLTKGLGFTTTTETFAESADYRIYLSIGSADEAVLPSAGYTIGIRQQ